MTHFSMKKSFCVNGDWTLKTVIAISLVLVSASGCMSAYESVALLPSHPASGTADEVSIYPPSEVLVAVPPDESNQEMKPQRSDKNIKEDMNHAMR